jgi:anti-sigma factor RsiW
MKHENDSPLSPARHRECWGQIAWIVNGTLAPHEYARVEAHLRACRECQDELDAQQRVRDAMRADDAVVLAPQSALQKLMQRIDAEDAPPGFDASAEAATGSGVRTLPGKTRWLAIAAAVQAIAIAWLLAAQLRSTDEASTEPRFETLTEPRVVQDGPVIRVVFADETALGDVGAILRSVDAQIVAGPSEAGVYTLALKPAPAAAPSDDTAVIDAALQQLRADDRVLFAESATARTAP